MLCLDDFRLLAASSLLKILVARHVDDNTGTEDEKVKNGQLPAMSELIKHKTKYFLQIIGERGEFFYYTCILLHQLPVNCQIYKF